jgi:hypothetical protein
MITVFPACFSLRILSLRCLAARGSNPAVGSSRMRISGSKVNAITAFTFCLVPPERVRRGRWSCSPRSNRSTNSGSGSVSTLLNSRSIRKSSAAERFSGRGGVWGMYPRFRRYPQSPFRVCSPTRMEPPSGLESPNTALMSVVFPEPLGPTRAVIRPVGKPTSNPLRTSSFPNDFRRS